MKFNKEFLSETVLYSGSDQTQKTVTAYRKKQ
jgi:hypothetical protein